MSVDISKLSKKELSELIREATKKKQILAKRQPITAVRSRLTRLAASNGYTIEELFGTPRSASLSGKKAAKKLKPLAKKVQPKYQDPSRPDQTWTGRGRQPRWLSAAIGRGVPLEHFLIGNKTAEGTGSSEQE